MRTAYKVRVYPTAAQAAVLNRTFGCVRLVWNAVLAWRQARYRAEGVTTSYAQTDRYLTDLKRDGGHDFLYEVSSVPLQQALRHQYTAFVNFFAGRAKYPRLKSRHGRQCATYTRSAFRWKDGRLHLAKVNGPIAFVWSWPGIDPATINPTTVAVSRDSDGRWYASFAVETEAGPDAGWGEFRRHLEYKTARAGRRLVVVDRWFPSSKTCSVCGHLLAMLSLSTRHWTCPDCGTRHDRDVNAAKNILAAGRAVSACGADVSPHGSSLRRSARKQETSPARVGIPSL
ncbi:RNA-guided endonuclease InsQ/TnpB family protein [Microbispora siamensis]